MRRPTPNQAHREAKEGAVPYLRLAENPEPTLVPYRRKDSSSAKTAIVD